jgi:shikimate dehydrogenase
LTIAGRLPEIGPSMPADPVFSLADLAAWSRPGTSLAVFGHPIKHSISPAMHNAALADLARHEAEYAEWRYFRFDIRPEDLPPALALLHAKKFRGVNLTVPHKVIAFERVTTVDAAARPVGAVNTLRWTAAGWHGFNTDGYGLSTAVNETLQRDLAGSAIILLGAGGAARGAAVECLQRGCASLAIANRTAANADALLAVLRPLAGRIPLRAFALEHPPADLPADALVINATSAGLDPANPPPIDLGQLRGRPAIYDMVYNPPRTALLQAASVAGLPQANGLSMLVHQGAKALEIWTGVPAGRTAPIMARAAHEALQT